MSTEASIFRKVSEHIAFDMEHRSRINNNIHQYDIAHEDAKTQFLRLDLARARAGFIRRKALEGLDKYLIEWESRFKRNGGKVIWAQDADEAITEVLRILKKHQVTKVVKSKSMVSDEIRLNARLKEHHIESIETDLGEYIQQLDEEPPYHIVSPAMHKSEADIASLFHDEFGTGKELNAAGLSREARQRIRTEYREAGASITGANFLLADIGGICITENEGNARLCTSVPKLHIAIVGLEKMLPTVNDLYLFLPLLATFGTGQKITAYNSIITGPKKRNELDGPEEMIVILLDNGRTELLGQVPQREALACIKCGACLNACPVFKNIGGHTYNTTYPGPIGSVITPFLRGFNDYVHLSQASTLCGACTEVCPVNIDLHKFLLYNRQKFVSENPPAQGDKIVWQLWKRSAMKRSFMNGGGSFKNILLKYFFFHNWSKHRVAPKATAKSFNEQWKERKKPF
jgi:L-lactate dehydrogenase complex protein LldF